MVNNYGVEASKRRAKKRQDKLEEQSKQKPKSLKSTKKSNKAPNIDWSPMDNKKINDVKFDSIDWSDKSTDKHSNHVVHKLVDEDLQMQLINMPPGSGKTGVAVATLGKMQEKLNEKIPFVVISTSKVVSGLGWHRTISWWNECHPDNQLEPVLITTVDKFKALCQHNKSKTRLIKLLTKNSILVLDEVHKYKNPVGTRAQQLQKLNMFKRLTLTATPLTNNQIDDIMSYLIIGNKYKNKTDFMRKSELDKYKGFRGAYMIFDEDGRVNEFIWPYYTKMLQEWGQFLYRPNIKYEDLDMPDVDRELIQLTPNKELFNDMKSLARAKNNRMFDSPIDYFMEVVERLHNDTQRLNVLMNIIKDKNSIQPLIFYQNTSVKNIIVKKLIEENINYQIVDGGSNFSEIDLNSDNPILIQYQSGSEGIEFKHSNTSIFYQNQWSYSTFKQAQGRNRRRGMKHQIKHYNIVADDPIDERIYNVILLREELNEEMLNDAIKQASEIYKD